MSFLDSYTRQPKLYIDLPSSGKFYDRTIIEDAQYVQIPVYSQTAADEIMLKTPDALFSGEAIVSIIKSCVPLILDPWKLVKTDLEYILTAIRIASHGNITDVSAPCQNCRNSNVVSVDLQQQLAHFDNVSLETSFDYQDLTMHLRPITFKQMTEFGIRLYQCQKMLQQIQNSNQPHDDKINEANSIASQIKQISSESLTAYIYKIEKGDQEELDSAAINKFIQQNDTEIAKAFVEKISVFINQLSIPEYQVKCGETTANGEPCLHEYEFTFSTDYSSFFVQ